MNTHMANISSDYPFKTKPMKHQLEVWLRSRDEENWAYFMEMGTGKSWLIINNASYLYDKGNIDALVILAPKGTYSAWFNYQIPEHMPSHVQYDIGVFSAYRTQATERKLQSLVGPGDKLKILVMNIEQLSSESGKAFAFLKQFMKVNRTLLAIDECSTIKHYNSARTKACLKLRTMAKYRRIATGTPLTQSPLDLYPQCTFLSPDLLGFTSVYSFRNYFCDIIQVGPPNRRFPKIQGYRNLDELAEMLTKFSSRIKKEECLDLPPKVFMPPVEVEWDDDQKKLYEKVKEEAFIELGNEQTVTAVMVLTRLAKMHQIVCGSMKLDDGTTLDVPNKRMEALLSFLEETNGKTIIWANYVHNLNQIVEVLKKKHGHNSVEAYYGGVSEADRERAVSRFQTDPTCRFFVGNPQTGGYGITLTAAEYVVYYSNSYNLEHRLQSEDRAHRIGQTKTVVYADLVVPETVDEKILRALRAKQDLAAKVVDWRELLT